MNFWDLVHKGEGLAGLLLGSNPLGLAILAGSRLAEHAIRRTNDPQYRREQGNAFLNPGMIGDIAGPSISAGMGSLANKILGQAGQSVVPGMQNWSAATGVKSPLQQTIMNRGMLPMRRPPWL